MLPPTIHLNGTSREQLLEQVSETWRKLSVAMDALCQMYPNGRDYYQGPDAIKQATAQHEAMKRKLREVMQEVQELGEAIADA